MYRMHQFAVLALAGGLLAACAAPGGMSESWRGKSEGELVSVWGKAGLVYVMDGGNKVLYFSDSDAASTVENYCVTSFSINDAGRVISASSYGVNGGCAELTSAKLAP